MTNDVNLGIGRASGMFYTAPAGTALPEYPTATLGQDWVEAGAISQDGITFATNQEFEPLKNWAQEIERLLPSENPGTVQAPIIDTTAASLAVLFEAENIVSTAATTEHGALTKVTIRPTNVNNARAFLFIGKDGDDTFMLGTTNGFISNKDDITFAPTEAITWNATISATEWTFVKDNGQTT